MIGPTLETVWGWPWHGLVEGGVVSGSGKLVTQPPNSAAWLIDMGISEPALSPSEAQEAAALGYEWRNYALIPGGRLYDTALPDNSYVYVDPTKQCWLITLLFDYVPDNQVQITARIRKLAIFGYGESSAFAEKVVTVLCEHIELTQALGNPFASYGTRVYRLDDVWTNGSKALVGVLLQTGSVDDLFSVIELTITGTGGLTGIGLSVSAVEVYGQSDLVYFTDSGHITLTNPFCGSFNWVASTAYQYYLPIWRDTFARYSQTAFYDSTGAAQYLAIQVTISDSKATCEDSWDQESATETCYNFATAVWAPTVERHLIARISSYTQLDLVVSGTVVDYIRFDHASFKHEWYTLCFGSFFSGLFTDQTIPEELSVSGSLASECSGVTVYPSGFASTLAAGWRTTTSPYLSSGLVAVSPVYLGLQRLDGKAAALFVAPTPGGARTWGPIVTPLGLKTYSGPSVSSDLYFAWQRKTGEYAFSPNRICYV